MQRGWNVIPSYIIQSRRHRPPKIASFLGRGSGFHDQSLSDPDPDEVFRLKLRIGGPLHPSIIETGKFPHEKYVFTHPKFVEFHCFFWKSFIFWCFFCVKPTTFKPTTSQLLQPFSEKKQVGWQPSPGFFNFQAELQGAVADLIVFEGFKASKMGGGARPGEPCGILKKCRFLGVCLFFWNTPAQTPNSLSKLRLKRVIWSNSWTSQ